MGLVSHTHARTPCRALGLPVGAWNASSNPWDFCKIQKTLSGCSCASSYPVDAINSKYMFGQCYKLVGGGRRGRPGP